MVFRRWGVFHHKYSVCVANIFQPAFVITILNNEARDDDRIFAVENVPTPVQDLNELDKFQVNCMALTQNGNQLAVGSWQRLRIYERQAASASLVASFENIHKNITAVGFIVVSFFFFSTKIMFLISAKNRQIFDFSGRKVSLHRRRRHAVQIVRIEDKHVGLQQDF